MPPLIQTTPGLHVHINPFLEAFPWPSEAAHAGSFHLWKTKVGGLLAAKDQFGLWKETLPKAQGEEVPS